jgi:hypothetical protein
LKVATVGLSVSQFIGVRKGIKSELPVGFSFTSNTKIPQEINMTDIIRYLFML